MQTHVHTHYHYGGMSDAQFQQLLTAIQAVQTQENKLMSQITDWAATEAAGSHRHQQHAEWNRYRSDRAGYAHPEFAGCRAASSIGASDLATLAQVKTQSAALVTQAAAISTAVPGSTTQAP